MAGHCSFIDKELKTKTVSIINNYIKEKETLLTLKKEEYNNLPDRYVVKGQIKNEVDKLSEEINDMKKTVSEIGCDK